MCRYAYYYFGACQHQHTVLLEFCDDARLPAAQPVKLSTNEGKSGGDEQSEDEGDTRKQEGANAFVDGNTTNLPSPTHSSQSRQTSFDIGLTSISTKFDIDSSSLHAEDYPSHSSDSQPAPAPSPDMAGLPLFGGTFRHWMSGTSTVVSEQSLVGPQGQTSAVNRDSAEALSTPASNSSTQDIRPRQLGIREHSDESCDLPNSDDIMQHLAESCRNRDMQHIGTDDRRMTSYGSTTVVGTAQDDREALRDSYESIEANIDVLKEEVSKLKDEAIWNEERQGRAEPRSEHADTIERYLASRSGRQKENTIAAQPVKESAAARLQKQHEMNAENKVNQEEYRKQRYPPNPLDFPLLGQSNSSSQVTSPVRPDFPLRKLSYADAATSNMMDALKHTNLRTRRADSKISESTSEDPIHAGLILSRTGTISTATTMDDCDADDDDDSVIISSKGKDSQESVRGEATVSGARDKLGRHQPHFAQPTKSFASRTGETVRKESSPVSRKQAKGGSMARSTKVTAPNIDTKKPAIRRPNQRGSLPVDWCVPAVGEKVDGDSSGAGEKQSQLTTDKVHKLPSSPAQPNTKVSGGTARHSGEPDKLKLDTDATSSSAKLSDPQSPLRKKASSYMAPTNATRSRNLATSTPDKPKYETPRRKPNDMKKHVAQEMVQPQSPPRSDTACSNDSSVHFILDQTGVNTGFVIPSYQSGPFKSYCDSPQLSPTGLQESGLSLLPAVGKPGRRRANSPAKHSKSPPHVGVKYGQGHDGYDGASSAATEKLAGLPQVANTTTKRRTSHGHLLKPIVACLDSKGLLDKSSKSALIESYLESTHVAAVGSTVLGQQRLERNAVARRPQAMSDISERSSGSEQTKKVLPPHLRKSREVSETSTSTIVTLCPQSSVQQNILEPAHPILAQSCIQNGPTTLVASSPEAMQTPLHMQPQSRTSSLRATASEFKPSSSPADTLRSATLKDSLKYISNEEWFGMSYDDRQAIRNVRRSLRTSAWHSNDQGSSHSSPVLMSSPYASNISNTAMTLVDGNGSPNVVQPGQILKPCLSPGKKSVHWTLRDLDGRETPIRFGRAPPPDAAAFFEPCTPSISSASDDTSPLKTPHSLPGWHIGSAFSPKAYGWVGGDGQEIKFIGYGPHAERDPNTVVDFSFQGHTASYSTSTPNGFSLEDKENLPSEGYVAPRSQRQWAEKFGYGKLPCGNVEITNAVEEIPFGPQLAGYCHDCMANR